MKWNEMKVQWFQSAFENRLRAGLDLVLRLSQVLSSEWKTEQVRGDSSGNSEDGEEDDDELPCVIRESEATGVHSGIHWRNILTTREAAW